jgi:hypothetical protein
MWLTEAERVMENWDKERPGSPRLTFADRGLWPLGSAPSATRKSALGRCCSAWSAAWASSRSRALCWSSGRRLAPAGQRRLHKTSSSAPNQVRHLMVLMVTGVTVHQSCTALVTALDNCA